VKKLQGDIVEITRVFNEKVSVLHRQQLQVRYVISAQELYQAMLASKLCQRESDLHESTNLSEKREKLRSDYRQLHEKIQFLKENMETFKEKFQRLQDEQKGLERNFRRELQVIPEMDFTCDK